MQPYFFPYIGYFQLMSEADVFVLYDDVQYMKGGWINRNRILRSGAPAWLTRPVERRSLGTLIGDMRYVDRPDVLPGLADAVRGSYRKAPRYEDWIGLIVELLEQEDRHVARYNEALLRGVAQAVGIGCEFVRSSDLDTDRSRRGQDRVLDICRLLGASRYTNAIGGTELYDRDTFREAGIELKFVRTTDVTYPQFDEPFVPNLSIIDVLMFNSPEQVAGLLARRELA